jgi:hypothetical protein
MAEFKPYIPQVVIFRSDIGGPVNVLKTGKIIGY